MPELPEVETVVRQLDFVMPRSKLLRVSVFDKKLKQLTRQAPIGLTLGEVRRVAKFIVLSFPATRKSRSKLASSTNLKDQCLGDPSAQKTGAVVYLAVHLRMTGRLVWTPAKSNIKKKSPQFVHQQPIDRDENSENKHLRAEFCFREGKLSFYDIRRFGTIDIVDSLTEIVPSGIDPFSREFNVRYLEVNTKGGRQPVKSWLLRQDFIHGIGNIYASEILFDAKVSPFRIVKTIKTAEWQRIRRSTLKILKKAILRGGTTFSDYRDARGQLGQYSSMLRVYEREGMPCKVCKSEILRFVQSGRSTYCCPRCQKVICP